MTANSRPRLDAGAAPPQKGQWYIINFALSAGQSGPAQGLGYSKWYSFSAGSNTIGEAGSSAWCSRKPHAHGSSVTDSKVGFDMGTSDCRALQQYSAAP